MNRFHFTFIAATLLLAFVSVGAVWAIAPQALSAPMNMVEPAAGPDETTASMPAAMPEYAPPVAVAAPAPTFDSGNTAWMLTSCAFVLLMTIPGLALFYGGMVRKPNVLNIIMQSFATCCLIGVLWMVAGYSLTFTEGNGFIGGFSHLFLDGITKDSAHALAPTIPESVFMLFQMTFAIITPALITGAFADRMKFSTLLVFMGLWSLIVYVPVAHMVWGGGLMAAGTAIGGQYGVMDFAGGTVVHINAGIAGLIACLVIGKRIGYGSSDESTLLPHNLVLSVVGASLLWVGWFGFNAGSAVAADGRAGMAAATTTIAACAAALSWMMADWAGRGKPSVIGMISGAVAGLVAITPASGFVDAKSALIIGLLAGVLCFWASTALKSMLGYDDALDVVGVHFMGGLLGAVLTGVFADSSIGGIPGAIEGNSAQVLVQIYGCLITIAYSGIATLVILKVLQYTMGLRVTTQVEREGLDLALHGERVHS